MSSNRLCTKVQVAFDWSLADLREEGAQDRIIEKEACYHAFGKLGTWDNASGTKAQIGREEMGTRVRAMREWEFQPYNWGPKELWAEALAGYRAGLGRTAWIPYIW